MRHITAEIDGKEIVCNLGTTILQAAQQVGIEIPTLCHIADLAPDGACRVCVVEVEGIRALVGSCHTPVKGGMVIHTRSPKVLATRKILVELMLTSHTGHCVNDPNLDNCRLHLLASDLEVGPPRFTVRKPRSYPIEEANPYIRRDLSKCIMCRRCVKSCREIASKNVLSIGYRGFQSKIVTGFDEALTTEACKDCLICIEYCPTGALSRAIDKDQ